MGYPVDRPFTLYFVRHGVTEPNFRGFRCGGDLDIPLMDIGCDQAYLLAKQIDKMNLRIGVIVTGTLIRTRQTASIISGVLGNVPVEVDPLFNERRLGQWNNRPIAETEELLAAKVTPPGGRPYFLIDSAGNGNWMRRDSLDDGVRVPQFPIKTFD